MADPSITVLTLGTGGIDVDSDPILTADNATLKSQNATYDPTASRGGALSKRPGLDRFNIVPFGGPILGGIEAPFAGTAGAPTSGGGGAGLPGDPGGTVGGQPDPGASGGGSYGVGPGSTITLGSNASTGVGPSGGNASYFTSGSVLFGGKKIIIVGRADSTTTGASGAGWYVTSKGFADIAQSVTESVASPMNGPSLARIAGGVTALEVGQTANHDQLSGFPPSLTEGLCARPNGILFYAQRTDPSESVTYPLPSTKRAVIRRNDGISDVVVTTIPDNSLWPVVTGAYATGHGMAVVGMGTRYGDGGNIFIAIHDRFGVGGVTVANDSSRIFRMDTSSYALTEVFNSYTGATNYNSVTGTLSPLLSGGSVEVWGGGMQLATGATSAVYGMVPSPPFNDGYANWTGYEGAYADKSDVTCMAIYKGSLFVGHINLAASPAFAVINGNPIGGGTLPANPQLTGSGGTVQANNRFVSMAIFQGKLYVSFYNATQAAKIYQFDGTNWTTVFTSGTFTHDLVPFNLHVDADGDVLYAYGSTSATITVFMTSVDGVTWVDKSANLTGDLSASGGGNFSTSQPFNVFSDFRQ